MEERGISVAYTEEYYFTVCGQTAVLYDAELAAALSLLPKQTQEENHMAMSVIPGSQIM